MGSDILLTLKTPEQRLSRKVDRLVAIKQAIQHLKQEQEALEGDLLRAGQADLADTKLKTVSYSGTAGRASVTMAKSLKLVYPSLLKEVFGQAYEDAIKPKVTYDVSKPASRMLAGLCAGEYTQMSVSDVISQLPADEGTKDALRKKLRGVNYATDKRSLMNIGGFDEEAAGSYAYFIAEAAVWDSFQCILEANSASDKAAYMLRQVMGACIVEESPKISIEILDNGG